MAELEKRITHEQFLELQIDDTTYPGNSERARYFRTRTDLGEPTKFQRSFLGRMLGRIFPNVAYKPDTTSGAIVPSGKGDKFWAIREARAKREDPVSKDVRWATNLLEEGGYNPVFLDDDNLPNSVSSRPLRDQGCEMPRDVSDAAGLLEGYGYEVRVIGDDLQTAVSETLRNQVEPTNGVPNPLYFSPEAVQNRNRRSMQAATSKGLIGFFLGLDLEPRDTGEISAQRADALVENVRAGVSLSGGHTPMVDGIVAKIGALRERFANDYTGFIAETFKVMVGLEEEPELRAAVEERLRRQEIPEQNQIPVAISAVDTATAEPVGQIAAEIITSELQVALIEEHMAADMKEPTLPEIEIQEPTSDQQSSLTAEGITETQTPEVRLGEIFADVEPESIEERVVQPTRAQARKAMQRAFLIQCKADRGVRRRPRFFEIPESEILPTIQQLDPSIVESLAHYDDNSIFTRRNSSNVNERLLGVQNIALAEIANLDENTINQLKAAREILMSIRRSTAAREAWNRRKATQAANTDPIEPPYDRPGGGTGRSASRGNYQPGPDLRSRGIAARRSDQDIQPPRPPRFIGSGSGRPAGPVNMIEQAVAVGGSQTVVMETQTDPDLEFAVSGHLRGRQSLQRHLDITAGIVEFPDGTRAYGEDGLALNYVIGELAEYGKVRVNMIDGNQVLTMDFHDPLVRAALGEASDPGDEVTFMGDQIRIRASVLA